MKTHRLWQGIRMRQVAASADPDRAARLVTLPATWDDRAAEALAALNPGDGPVTLAVAASAWLSQIGQRARQSGQDNSIVHALQGLLQRRQAAPNPAIWSGQAAAPGFTLYAAGFHDATDGFDVAGFAEAASLAARACLLLTPDAARLEIGFAGLDDLLACLGLDYDSRAARAVGACLAALLRAQVEQALEGDQPDLLAVPAAWPAPPTSCPVPGLAAAANAARASLRRVPGAIPATGIFPPGPTEALLGVETGGIAPAFSPVRERFLTRAAHHRLAAAAISPEAALATVLTGGVLLPVADLAAHAAMRESVGRYLDFLPPLPASLPVPAETARSFAPRHEKLPPRRAGLTQKASIGGHRVFLQTGEYADGRLGEIALHLPRESAFVRGLAECFAQALSLGLQHGVKLEEFVEAFSLTRFGPCGLVEGDSTAERATSVVDYAMRALSANYLGRVLPEPEPDEEMRLQEREVAPMLPLDLPRRRGLRLVA
jgi:ribonucleoside-diphosphate reductase alpha chain